MNRIYRCTCGKKQPEQQCMYRIEVPTMHLGTRHQKRCLPDKIQNGHLRIFGFPVYVHVPKDERSKLDPLGKKGIFVGYSETSKAYRVYISSHRQIEISRDVTFDEDVAFSRSRKNHIDEVHDEDSKAPEIIETEGGSDIVPEEYIPKDHDMIEPQRPAELSREKNTNKRPAWAWEAI
jgi:hypothetical protein